MQTINVQAEFFANNFGLYINSQRKNQYRTRSLLLLCLLLANQKIEITITFLQISRKPKI